MGAHELGCIRAAPPHIDSFTCLSRLCAFDFASLLRPSGPCRRCQRSARPTPHGQGPRNLWEATTPTHSSCFIPSPRQGHAAAPDGIPKAASISTTSTHPPPPSPPPRARGTPSPSNPPPPAPSHLRPLKGSPERKLGGPTPLPSPPSTQPPSELQSPLQTPLYPPISLVFSDPCCIFHLHTGGPQ
jgi:Wiskott-Aldrich syndrome protein